MILSARAQCWWDGAVVHLLGRFAPAILRDNQWYFCSGQFGAASEAPVEDRLSSGAKLVHRADLRDVALINLSRDALAQSKISFSFCETETSSALLDFFAQNLNLLPNTSAEVWTRHTDLKTAFSWLLAAEQRCLVLPKFLYGALLHSVGVEGEMAHAAKERCSLTVIPLQVQPGVPGKGLFWCDAVGEDADRADLASALLKELRSKAKLCSVLPRSYGDIVICDQHGGIHRRLEPNSASQLKANLPRAAQHAAIAAGFELFERVPLEHSRVEANDHIANAVWVARVAPGINWEPLRAMRVVWCAGLRTWRALSQLGVFVTGCAEELGEEEDPALEFIEADLSWEKWTHAGALADRYVLHPLYELKPNGKPVEVAGLTHFFWRSGSSARAVFAAHPEISKSFHGCGPGNTYAALKKLLAAELSAGAANLRIFLSEGDFRAAVEPEIRHDIENMRTYG